MSHVAALERGDPDAQTAPLQSFPILESEYARLDACLEEADLYGFYHDKVRNDYDPSLEQLIIRMPTNRHIIFIRKSIELILTKITAQARILEHDHPTICRRLLQLGSMSTSDIQLLSDNGKVGHKSPDVSIGYPDRVYPQVVFEVAYNQDRGALERLAWDYIMGSSHYIRCVLGLTPDYLQYDSPFSPSPAHNARVSVWRPLVQIEDYMENMDVKQETKDQRLGECNPDRAIAVLSLRDLLDVETPEEKATAPDIDFKIVVTSGEMIDILTSAELCLERSRKQREHLLLESQNQNYIWRKRRSTPDKDKRNNKHSKR